MNINLRSKMCSGQSRYGRYGSYATVLRLWILIYDLKSVAAKAATAATVPTPLQISTLQWNRIYFMQLYVILQVRGMSRKKLILVRAIVGGCSNSLAFQTSNTKYNIKLTWEWKLQRRGRIQGRIQGKRGNSWYSQWQHSLLNWSGSTSYCLRYANNSIIACWLL